MKIFVPAALAATLGCVGFVQAQGLGGELSFNVASVENGGFGTPANILNAGFSANLGGSIGAQASLSTWGHDGAMSDQNGFEGHVFFNVSPGTKAGLFFTREDYFGDVWSHIGVEAISEIGIGGPNPLTIEGYAGNYNLDGDHEHYLLSIAGSLPLGPNISGIARLANVTGPDDATVVEIGGRYTHENGMFAELTATRSSGDIEYSTVGIEVGFVIGDGLTFGGRRWIDHFGD